MGIAHGHVPHPLGENGLLAADNRTVTAAGAGGFTTDPGLALLPGALCGSLSRRDGHLHRNRAPLSATVCQSNTRQVRNYLK
jgi:hypothetical protein